MAAVMEARIRCQEETMQPRGWPSPSETADTTRITAARLNPASPPRQSPKCQQNRWKDGFKVRLMLGPGLSFPDTEPTMVLGNCLWLLGAGTHPDHGREASSAASSKTLPTLPMGKATAVLTMIIYTTDCIMTLKYLVLVAVM